MKILTLVCLLLLLCLPAGITAEQSPLNVVATTTQAADLVKIVGGDRVNVIGLMGGGVDPHLYQFTESDVAAMSSADVVIYSGIHLEGRISEVLGEVERRAPVYALATPVEEQGYLLVSQGKTDVPDPHFWFDPRNWQLATEGLVNFLSEIDPDNADLYAANGETFIEQLELLYQWGVEAMSLVPENQRVLITSHDAFQYFGDAFGWSVRGLQGISTEDEAGVGDIQALVDFIVENQIPTMFVESSVPPDTIEAVRQGASSKGWEVSIGGQLYSDAMGEVGTFGGTYIGMIQENIALIVTAFGYGDQIPEWPAELPQPEDFAQANAN